METNQSEKTSQHSRMEQVPEVKNDSISSYDGAKIRDLRVEKGWTQERFAAEAGVSKGTISGVEHAKISVKRRTFSRIAGVLEIDLETLVLLPKEKGEMTDEESQAELIARARKSLTLSLKRLTHLQKQIDETLADIDAASIILRGNGINPFK